MKARAPTQAAEGGGTDEGDAESDGPAGTEKGTAPVGGTTGAVRALGSGGMSRSAGAATRARTISLHPDNG
jgi:hypothetical protein